MDEMLKDTRFAHIAKDPKFRRIPKSERKIKIDKRFQSMFNDKKFTIKHTIDKRGRPVNQTSSENLRKYYDLSSSEEEEEEEDQEEVDTEGNLEVSKAKKKTLKKGSGKTLKTTIKSRKVSKEKKENKKDVSNSETKLPDTSEDSDSDNTAESINEENDLNANEKEPLVKNKNARNKITKDIKKKLRDLTVDYARGEGVLLSDSSSEEESSEHDNDDEEEIEHDWGELDKAAETTDEITRRLAACNMDWDRIRAVDLMVLFNSFLPPGGLIHSITIYPSDFGLQRMKDEEIKGPIELVEADKNRKDAGSDEEDEEGSEYHREKMRQYQLNRLKYYYAVVDCDSMETANKIYTECDGIEYESTSTKLDLRFIPDDMEFEHEPKEVCDKLPELAKYQPRQFTTTALQQVKVELTWDETNPERQEITQKINSGKINEIDESDIQAYLASGTSEDESEDDRQDMVNRADDPENDGKSKKNPIDKYKSLLKSIDDQDQAKKKQEVELEFTWGLGTKEKAEKLVKERMNKVETLTPFEQYLEKRKAKKKAKREERRKTREQNGDDSVGSESDDSVPSDVDMNDPYFAEEMKNTKGKEKKSRKKKNLNDEADSSNEENEAQRKAELELLLLDKGDEEGKQHFNIKKIEEEATLSKSKRKRMIKKKKNDKETKIQDDFEVDVGDPRFGALYSSHHFNIDPADPHYRKTKGTEALVTEKLKRRADPNVKEELSSKKPKPDKGKMSADLAALVKSVKRNTQNISKPIK